MYIKNKGLLSVWIISALILLGSFTAKSQDSTKISDKDLRAGLAVFYEWQFQILEIKAKDENIAIMANQIDTKNAQLKKYKEREQTFTNLISAYKQDSTLAASQINVYIGMTTSLKKDLKKQRTKTVLVGIAGVLVAGFTAYITTR